MRTKYGTKDEFLRACQTCRDAGIRVYADAVFNHKMGGDAAEAVQARRVNPEHRWEVTGEIETIEAWTHFQFPGRGAKYSSMEWHWHHFQAVDQQGEDGYHIYLFDGKQFDPNVDGEKGNFDFLMGCDVDMDHPEVVGELEFWGEWFVNTTGVDGFRFERPPPDFRQHTGRATPDACVDAGGESRLTAASGAGVGRGSVVQAAGIRADPAAQRRLSVGFLRRLFRRSIQRHRR